MVFYRIFVDEIALCSLVQMIVFIQRVCPQTQSSFSIIPSAREKTLIERSTSENYETKDEQPQNFSVYYGSDTDSYKDQQFCLEKGSSEIESFLMT